MDPCPSLREHTNCTVPDGGGRRQVLAQTRKRLVDRLDAIALSLVPPSDHRAGYDVIVRVHMRTEHFRAT